MGFSSLNYVFFVLELPLVVFWLSVMMAPFNRAWAQLTKTSKRGTQTPESGWARKCRKFSTPSMTGEGFPAQLK